jgi:hypothetical protein
MLNVDTSTESHWNNEAPHSVSEYPTQKGNEDSVLEKGFLRSARHTDIHGHPGEQDKQGHEPLDDVGILPTLLILKTTC